MQLLAKDPVWLEKRRSILKRQQEDPVISKKTKEALLRLHNDPAWKANQRCVMEQVKSDPTYSDKQVKGFRKWLKGWSKSRTTIESKVLTTLKDIGVTFVDQKELGGYFYDFYLPDQKVLIEVDGCFWHGCSECGFKRIDTNNDEPKNQLAVNLGMTLIRLPEHSINANPSYVREVLQSILGR
jgi:very-short-patch-repair endonuclease